jgi:hypothetical protein
MSLQSFLRASVEEERALVPEPSQLERRPGARRVASSGAVRNDEPIQGDSGYGLVQCLELCQALFARNPIVDLTKGEHDDCPVVQRLEESAW